MTKTKGAEPRKSVPYILYLFHGVPDVFKLFIKGFESNFLK